MRKDTNRTTGRGNYKIAKKVDTAKVTAGRFIPVFTIFIKAILGEIYFRAAISFSNAIR